MTPFALIAALALAAPAAPAKKEAPKEDTKAADAAKAKELFAWAQRLYQQARYAEAIAKFEEVYGLKPAPVIYYNIGKCYEQLNETAKAMRAYKDYLRLAPDAKDKETITDAIANLERRLKEKGLQQVIVYAEPTSARIEVDGKDLGTSPASIELIAGNHRLTVKADGFETADRSFIVAAGQSKEITQTLKANKEVAMNPFPAPPPPPPIDTPKKDDPKKVASLTPDHTKDPPVGVVGQNPPPKKGGRVFTWVAAGTAVGAGVAGAVFGSMAGSAADDLHKKEHTQADAQKLYNDANSFSTGANVSYAVAGTAAATAVVLFILEK